MTTENKISLLVAIFLGVILLTLSIMTMWWNPIQADEKTKTIAQSHLDSLKNTQTPPKTSNPTPKAEVAKPTSTTKPASNSQAPELTVANDAGKTTLNRSFSLEPETQIKVDNILVLKLVAVDPAAYEGGKATALLQTSVAGQNLNLGLIYTQGNSGIQFDKERSGSAFGYKIVVENIDQLKVTFLVKKG